MKLNPTTTMMQTPKQAEEAAKLREASTMLTLRRAEKDFMNMLDEILKNVSHARVHNDKLRTGGRNKTRRNELYDTDEPSSYPSPFFEPQQEYIRKYPIVPVRRPRQQKQQAAPASTTEDATAESLVKEAAAEARETKVEVEVEPPKPKLDLSRGMLLGEWIKATKPYHLTAGDIMSLEDGDMIVAVSLSDNVCQRALNDQVNRRGNVTSPYHFLRCNHWMVYTHKHGFQGRASWFRQSQFTSQIEYFQNDTAVEFNVEFAPNQWFPLTRGSINRQAFLSEYDEYPSDFRITSETRVGFGGPMIIVQYLSKCPMLTRRG